MTRFPIAWTLAAGVALAAVQAHAQIKPPAGSATKPPATQRFSEPLGSGLSKPGAGAPAAKPQQPDAKHIQDIFSCLAAGLPEDWSRVRVVLTELAAAGGTRDFDAAFTYRVSGAQAKDQPLEPCDREQVFKGVYQLNENLPTFEQRQWKSVTVTFIREGQSGVKFDLQYDYAR